MEALQRIQGGLWSSLFLGGDTKACTGEVFGERIHTTLHFWLTSSICLQGGNVLDDCRLQISARSYLLTRCCWDVRQLQMAISSWRLPVCALLSPRFTEWHQGKVTAGAPSDQTRKTPAKMQKETFRAFFFISSWPAHVCSSCDSTPSPHWLSCSLAQNQIYEYRPTEHSCFAPIYSPCFKDVPEIPQLTAEVWQYLQQSTRYSRSSLHHLKSAFVKEEFWVSPTPL